MECLAETEYWDAASNAFSNDVLELTILPTEQCNLRCAYCYEKFELSTMAPETVTAIQRLLERRAPELRRLKIDWFGGEPLLAHEVIEAVCACASSLAERNPFLQYTASATTNGVLLTEPMARRLSDLGVRHFHVSLDGPQPAHDQTRSARGGRGTFAKLMRNLEAIQDSDIELRIELRIHVTPLNVALLEEFVDQLARTLLRDARFSAYFFPIVDLGGPKQGDFPVLRHREAAAIVARLAARLHAALAAGHAPRTDAAAEQTGEARNADGRRVDCGSAYVCYAAKANAWVIRADGRLAKCTVGFDDERNEVGRLTPDGLLSIATDRVRPWMRGWTTGNRMDLHCPYEGMRDDVRSGAVEARG